MRKTLLALETFGLRSRLRGDDGAGPAVDDPQRSIADAVEQQLGLRLIDTNRALDLIVVDRAERIPEEN